MTPDSTALEGFRQRFGGTPGLRVDAPGRVNLIGEHIDYNGLAVLPIAIPRQIHLFVKARDDASVRIQAADHRFGFREFELARRIRPFAPGDWGNYPKAAAQELMREMHGARGMDVWLESNLPVAAGLSSSSAIVVAVGLALLHVNDWWLPMLELATRMAEAERYVGTRGGGMDQAICLAAQEGHACRIEFDPLRVQPIAVPSGWRFVIAYSGVSAEKSGTARDAYNQRTQQCAEALGIVAGSLNAPDASYAELTARWRVDDLLTVAKQALTRSLLARFRHVVTEANRVRRAEEALCVGTPQEFGALMNASHDSLRDDYGVSTPELDAMVSIARSAGAAGARLTGAGFGGSVVALGDKDSSPVIMHALERDYFASRGGAAANTLFAVTPAAGASVRMLQDE